MNRIETPIEFSLFLSLEIKEAPPFWTISPLIVGKPRISSWQRAQLRRWAEMLPWSNQSGMEDALPRPNPGSTHAHYYSEEPSDAGARAERRHWWAREASPWVGRSPTNGKSPPFGRDNNGSSYARVRRIGGRRWEKIVTDIAPMAVAWSLHRKRNEHSTNRLQLVTISTRESDVKCMIEIIF